MPSKKKKYNARFPAVSFIYEFPAVACDYFMIFFFKFSCKRFQYCVFQGRIKKIMQMDDDVGKIAHGVPVVIYILSITTSTKFTQTLCTPRHFIDDIVLTDIHLDLLNFLSIRYCSRQRALPEKEMPKH